MPHFLQPVNDEAPSIITEQLFVQEGHQVAVTNTSVFITDLDTIVSDLMITVESAPEHGKACSIILNYIVIKFVSIHVKEHAFKKVLEQLQ